jgi:hypothetical protein
MYNLFLLLLLTGIILVLYRSKSVSEGESGAPAVSLLFHKLWPVLPPAAYGALAALDLLLGSGALAANPVYPAAALFYMILILATRRLGLSLALSLGIAVLSTLSSPLL